MSQGRRHLAFPRPLNLLRKRIVKREQFKGMITYMAGSLQEKYGRLIGDHTLAFEGLARQVEGKLQGHGLPLQTSAKR